MRKNCTKCGKNKDLQDFSVAKKNRDGRSYFCKRCLADDRARFRANNPPSASQREKLRKQSEAWRNKNPDKRVDSFLKSVYGVTLNKYKEMFDAQGGLCAICGEPETAKYRGKTKRLNVDHCHKTRRIRGLLCNSCNRGIGFLKDDPKVCISAYNYLKGKTDVRQQAS